MPEIKIERYATITVVSTQKNQYGDLIVNESLKVSNKRSQLFDVFQPGAEVKVGYAVYMNREYIVTAEQTGVHVVPASPLVKAAIAKGGEVITKQPTEHDSKARSMAIAYAKDLAAAGKIELQDMTVYADKFLEYMNK